MRLFQLTVIPFIDGQRKCIVGKSFPSQIVIPLWCLFKRARINVIVQSCGEDIVHFRQKAKIRLKFSQEHLMESYLWT